MRIRLQWLIRLLVSSIAILLFAHTAAGHITISPKESIYGEREKYTIRVPNEKQVATIRIEGDFPNEVNIYSVETKPGWEIEFKKDEKGKIIGAVWTGRIAPSEFVEFGMLGINPKEGSALVWKFIQYYEDGTKQEFTGPAGSRLPAPVTILKRPAASPDN